MRGLTDRPLVSTMAAMALAVAFAATHAYAQSNRDRIRCESQNGREQFCRASIGGDVRVSRQLSNTRCIEGNNWRWDRNGITVRDGCRAEFDFRRADWGGSGGSGGSWGGSGGSWGGGGGSRRDLVTCQGRGNREQFCPAPIDGDVRLERQLGDTTCVQGRNWNWNRDGVRVVDGCRGEFSFRRRSDGSQGAVRNGRVTCQSQNNRQQFCPAPIDGNVRVFRNMSDVRCRENVNYSWSNDGVRVWNGCRAEFEFRQRN